MTSEQRLDRLERIAKLMASAGLRARKEFREHLREHDEQIVMLMNAQSNLKKPSQGWPNLKPIRIENSMR